MPQNAPKKSWQMMESNIQKTHFDWKKSWHVLISSGTVQNTILPGQMIIMINN